MIKSIQTSWLLFSFIISESMCFSSLEMAKTVQLDRRNLIECSQNQFIADDVCQDCHYSCKLCTDASYNSCKSCYVESNRYLIQSQCLCQSTYYNIVGEQYCQTCRFPCNQCNSLTNCLTCQSNLVLKQNQCVCNQYQYFDYDNRTCQNCHFSCEICIGPNQNDCLTCPSIRSWISGMCVCPDGYYDNNLLILCQQCNQNCKICNGPGSNNCLNCYDSHQSGSSCICQDGYFHVNDIQCQKCHPTCKTCIDQYYYNCSSCNGNSSLNTITGICECATGYFLSNSTCLICDLTACLTCIYQSTFCLTCASPKVVNSSGVCVSKQFQLCKRLTSNPDGTCSQCINGQYGTFCEINCDSNCLSCSTSATICTTCSSPLQLSGSTCQCPAGQTLINNTCSSCSANCATCTSGTCGSCQDGYYGINCSSICPSICKSCYSGGCHTCRDHGYVFGTGCVCYLGYYMDSNENCQKCHYTCYECTNGDDHSCTDCGWQYRDPISNQCICRTGYYDFGISMCQTTIPNCGKWCANCTNSMSVYTCTACQMTATNRINDVANHCPCIDGYYDDGTMVCASCSYKCTKCVDSTSCMECAMNRDINNNCNCDIGSTEISQVCVPSSGAPAPTVIVLVNYETLTQQSYSQQNCNLINYYDKTTCKCLDGYYLNLINYKCLPCNTKCQTCILNSTNCLICQDYSINPPDCNCSIGYYLIDNQCKSCEQRCIQCQNNGCQNCAIPYIFNNNSCPCLNSYYNLNNQCYQCDQQCLECQYQSNYCRKCKFNRILPYKCLCPDGTIDLGINVPCQECKYKCNTCQIDPLNCITCSEYRIQPPLCQCQQGYYEDQNQNCKKCNQNCQTCQNNENNCITCITLRYGDQCQNCIDGYYQGYDNICHQCNQRCKTCSNSSENNCLNCDESKNLYLNGSQCLCNKGYYYSNYQCNVCTIEIVECQSNYCGDGIKQQQEECDDFNRINKDGCTSNCKIQQGYYCTLIQNIKLDKSIYFSQCQQCQDINCQTCYNNICQICKSGYYITQDKQCNRCNDHCQQCNGNLQNQCILCNIIDYKLPQKCSYCEEYIGLYTFEQQCISKCGDGIKKLNEQCDDGNQLSGDGCSSNCQIEQNYYCNQQLDSIGQCYLLDNPIAILQFNNSNLYSSIRQGKIIFNKPMIINITLAEQLWKQQIYVKQQELINMSTNLYEIQLEYIQLNDQLLYQEILINIQLYETSWNMVYQIDFSQYLILASDHTQLQTFNLTQQLNDYFKVDTLTINVSQASRKFGLIVLIIIGCIALLGLLLQSLEFYWNFLDLLQMIIYLTYINIQFPYAHNQFVTLFEFAQFDFLNDLIPTNFINIGKDQETHNYPLLVDKNVEENIVYNLGSIIIVYITPFSILIFAKFLLTVLNKRVINAILQLNPNTYLGKCDLKLNILEMLYFILKLCAIYIKSFFYKIILRVYLSSLYDLNFAIFTVIYCSIWNDSPNLNQQIQQFIACILIVAQFGVLFILSPSLMVHKYSIREYNFEKQYGSLYEGVVIGNLYNREVAFLQPLKKMIFMASIIVFYDNPLNQIGMLITIQMISTIIYLTLKPNESIFETIKSFVNELGLFFSLFFILFYYVQQELHYVEQQIVERAALGHIGIYILMMVVQVVVDVYQQFKVLLHRYPKLKQLCNSKKQTFESHNYYNNQQFIVITPPLVKPRRF